MLLNGQRETRNLHQDNIDCAQLACCRVAAVQVRMAYAAALSA
jgi:hypothetical protein